LNNIPFKPIATCRMFRYFHFHNNQISQVYPGCSASFTPGPEMKMSAFKRFDFPFRAYLILPFLHLGTLPHSPPGFVNPHRTQDERINYYCRDRPVIPDIHGGTSLA
jgi:hypothetical protein